MSRVRPPRYSPEFKAEALRLVAESKAPLRTIARELGMSRETLRKWIEAARPPARGRLTEDERAELQRLRRENRRLEMERDILKKATAFFARQNE
jgi:transposase